VSRALASRRVRIEDTLERVPEECALEEALAGFIPLGKGLRVTLTNNRFTMVSVKRAQAGYTVRLHRMFVGAEPRLMRAIARYVVHNDRRASEAIGAFIEHNQHIIRRQVRTPRLLKIRTQGRVYDLQALFDRVNADRFEGRLEARITWGSAPARRRPRRSIKMGSFSVEDRIIRIHPVLDQVSVPEYFVAWIVFHEMLHGKHEVVRKDGRRCFHGPEFVAEEKTFADYERAVAWERANIDRLLGG
jgi:hypothetical protein